MTKIYPFIMLLILPVILLALEPAETKLSLGAIGGFGSSVLGSIEDNSDWTTDDLGYIAPIMSYRLKPQILIKLEGTQMRRSNSIELKQGLYTKGVLRNTVLHLPVSVIYELPSRANRNKYFLGGGIYFDQIIKAELMRRRNNGSEITTDVIGDIPPVSYGLQLTLGSRFSRVFYSELRVFSDLTSYDLQDLNQENLRNSGFLILLGMDLINLKLED